MAGNKGYLDDPKHKDLAVPARPQSWYDKLRAAAGFGSSDTNDVSAAGAAKKLNPRQRAQDIDDATK